MSHLWSSKEGRAWCSCGWEGPVGKAGAHARGPKPKPELALSRKERDQFFKRHFPTLKGEGKAPVEAGYVHVLSSQLRFEVTGVRIKRGGWKLEYVVFDQRTDRSRYLLAAGHTVPVGDKARWTEDAEKGYTGNRKATLADDCPSVPSEYQDVLVMQAHSKWADRTQTERKEQQAREDARRFSASIRDILVAQARSGVDSTEFLSGLARLVKQNEQRRAA